MEQQRRKWADDIYARPLILNKQGQITKNVTKIGGNIVRCSCSRCDDYDNKLAQYNGVESVDGSTQTVTADHAMYSSHNETMVYQTRNNKTQRGKLEKEG